MAYTTESITTVNSFGATIDDPTLAAREGLIDYIRSLTLSLGIPVGMTELRGLRPSQQDAMDVQQIFYWHGLNQTERVALLHKAYTSGHQLIGNEDYPLNTGIYQPGSTAVSVFVSKDSEDSLSITCSYLGDSEALIFEYSKDGSSLRSITNNLHTCKSAAEKARIDAVISRENWPSGKPQLTLAQSPIKLVRGITQVPSGAMRLSTGRHNATLSVTGGFGDKIFGELVRREPAIEHDTIHQDTKRSFIILACDGVRESIKTNVELHEFLHNALESAPSINTSELSHQLATAANERGSKDNISVIVAEIDPSKMKLGETFVFNIFDGHGLQDKSGRLVAEALSEHFTSIIQAHLVLANVNRFSSQSTAENKLKTSESPQPLTPAAQYELAWETANKTIQALSTADKRIIAPFKHFICKVHQVNVSLEHKYNAEMASILNCLTDYITTLSDPLCSPDRLTNVALKELLRLASEKFSVSVLALLPAETIYNHEWLVNIVKATIDAGYALVMPSDQLVTQAHQLPLQSRLAAATNGPVFTAIPKVPQTEPQPSTDKNNTDKHNEAPRNFARPGQRL